MRRLIFLLLMIVSFSDAVVYKKVALVMANSNYEFGGILENTIEDYNRMRDFLTKGGFKIFLAKNKTLSQMKRSLNEARSKVAKDGVFVLYFSGHGVEVDGKNFLLPIDNDNIHDMIDLSDRSLGLNYLIQKMQSSKSRLNLVMVDACRNNPYSFTKGDKGLKIVSSDKLDKTFLVFAGEPKKTLRDDGLFTKTFIKHASKPLSLGDLFVTMRADFKKKGRNGIYTNNRATEIFRFTQPTITPKLTISPRVNTTTYQPKVQKRVKDEHYQWDYRVYRGQRSYRKNSTNTVKDNYTGLLWQKSGSSKSMTYQKAKAYCEAQTTDGYTNWRLPSLEELTSISDITKSKPAIDSRYFNVKNNAYWSTTEYKNDASRAWGLFFNDGNDGWNFHSGNNYVLCVQ